MSAPRCADCRRLLLAEGEFQLDGLEYCGSCKPARATPGRPSADEVARFAELRAEHAERRKKQLEVASEVLTAVAEVVDAAK